MEFVQTHPNGTTSTWTPERCMKWMCRFAGFVFRKVPGVSDVIVVDRWVVIRTWAGQYEWTDPVMRSKDELVYADAVRIKRKW